MGQAKGYSGGQSKLFKTAKERVARALQFAYRDRRVRKREFRSLWITRIGIAAKTNGFNYSKLMSGLKKANVEINRKILADLAIKSPKAFSDIVALAKSHFA